MNITHLSYPECLSSPVYPEIGQVLAIGYFDGVHLGHQEVIRRALALGDRHRLPVAVMTFHPHPKEVLGKLTDANYLTPYRAKMQQFAKWGIDHTYIVRFDSAFARVSPEQFVHEMLGSMRVKAVVVGFNFTFGHLGRGTTDTLVDLCRGSIDVDIVAPCMQEYDKVSSTLIRQLLREGRVERVQRLLGRAYSITGTVVRGEGRGRTIGIPTANLQPDEPYFIPGNGVYAVKASVGGETVSGVMNIGLKPTFTTGISSPTLEAHLFHFDKDIYGESITVEFAAFLRKETRFSSVEQLLAQIRHDMEVAQAKLVTAAADSGQ